MNETEILGGLLHNLACSGCYRNALIKTGEQNLSLGQTLSLLWRSRSSRIVPVGQGAESQSSAVWSGEAAGPGQRDVECLPSCPPGIWCFMSLNYRDREQVSLQAPEHCLKIRVT